MLILKNYNDDCRACLDISSRGEVSFSMETKIDEHAPFERNGRTVSIGSLASSRNSITAEFVNVDYRSPTSPIDFVQMHFGDESSALDWLASQVDLKKLPARFQRAIEITSASH
jgi:hypothetical protein